MLTDDYHERNTEYSDAVQITVRDYNGHIRVFNIDNAKVILRYIDSASSFAYHPENIVYSGGFRPSSGHHLELVIATEDLIVLESDKNES